MRPSAVTMVLLGSLALDAGRGAAGADFGRAGDLGRAAAVESQRQQTQLRFQQAIRASRESTSPASRASRDRLERMRLDALGARQQRQASATEPTLRAAPRAQAEGRRHLTLQRFEREQRLEVDRARTAVSGPPGRGDATDPAGPGGLPDRRRPGRIEASSE